MSQQRTAGTLTGSVYGAGANMLGALGFIVPNLLARFPALQITIGRYLCYGLFSLVLVAIHGRGTLRQYDPAIWRTSLGYALAANLGYFFCVVLGVQYAGAAVTALIIGTLPVTVALYGNWRRREFPFSRLALPLGLIFGGLTLINVISSRGNAIPGVSMGPRYVFGILCATLGLALWTWYAIANAAFLRSRPGLSAFAWSSLTGINTLLLSCGVVIVSVIGERLGFGVSAVPAHLAARSLLLLLAGSVALGLGASWISGWLWNRASTMLPISLAGQLIVCEPLAVLVYVFVTGHRLPQPLEILGITLVIGGVLIGVRQARA